MGIGKKVVERKTKKVVENVTGDIPVVGDMVDKNIKSGPMDRAGDTMDKGKDKLGDARGKVTGGVKKPKNPLKGK
jgi:hypothetical protein